MVDIRSAFNNLFYEPKKTPTSGQAERQWFTNLKKATGQAAVASAAPVIAGSGITRTAAGATIRAAKPVASQAARKLFNSTPYKKFANRRNHHRRRNCGLGGYKAQS